VLTDKVSAESVHAPKVRAASFTPFNKGATFGAGVKEAALWDG
jgi:hypothetical protein